MNTVLVKHKMSYMPCIKMCCVLALVGKYSRVLFFFAPEFGLPLPNIEPFFHNFINIFVYLFSNTSPKKITEQLKQKMKMRIIQWTQNKT